MEIGQSVVSTEEYIRLKEIQQKYLNATKEFEEKADKILIVKTVRGLWGLEDSRTVEYVGRDAALSVAGAELQHSRTVIEGLRRGVDKSFGARLRFLFTGETLQLLVPPKVKME